MISLSSAFKLLSTLTNLYFHSAACADEFSTLECSEHGVLFFGALLKKELFFYGIKEGSQTKSLLCLQEIYSLGF